MNRSTFQISRLAIRHRYTILNENSNGQIIIGLEVRIGRYTSFNYTYTQKIIASQGKINFFIYGHFKSCICIKIMGINNKIKIR